MNPYTTALTAAQSQPDEAWRQYMARQERLQTEHLERIRGYVGALVAVMVGLVIIGVPLTIFF